MPFGIGVDCEEISRFRKIRPENTFLDKAFTIKELSYCKSKPNPSQHLAVRFAGKEAVIKAFSSLDKMLFFKDIEILNDKNGVPYAKILKSNVSRSFNVRISLSHSKNNAIAFAVVVGENGKTRLSR